MFLLAHSHLIHEENERPQVSPPKVSTFVGGICKSLLRSKGVRIWWNMGNYSNFIEHTNTSVSGVYRMTRVISCILQLQSELQYLLQLYCQQWHAGHSHDLLHLNSVGQPHSVHEVVVLLGGKPKLVQHESQL